MVKAEKGFLHVKLENAHQMMSNHNDSELHKLLQIEKSRSDLAEKARAQLAGELALIKKQLDLEYESIQKCKRFLDPDELQKVEEADARNSISPSSSLQEGSSLTISDQILLKYKRAQELRVFFETKYQSQVQMISDLQHEQ